MRAHVGSPDWRQKGLGSALMGLIDSIGIITQMHLIMLTVLTNNQAASRFYARLGFAVDEASPGVFVMVNK